MRDYASVSKRIDHPVVGELAFDIEIVASPRDPDQHLVVYTAEPDSATARVLPLLRSWNATVDGSSTLGDTGGLRRSSVTG